MALRPILVTGGNKGIGKAICSKLLTDYDDTIVFLASRDAGRGQAARQDLLRETQAKNHRLHCIELDTSSDDSVQAAAQAVETVLSSSTQTGQDPISLYGICNNAGVLDGVSVEELINVNFMGPQRVNQAFGRLLPPQGEGRIVNIASGSAPWFVGKCHDRKFQKALTQPWIISGGIPELNQMVQQFVQTQQHHYDHQLLYGLSKAALNAYTWWLAQDYKTSQIRVNSVTPGWIKTDMTANQGATNPPSKGAVPPLYLLMDNDIAKASAQGRYYGSDCRRSPFHTYRDPGSAPYDGPDGP